MFLGDPSYVGTISDIAGHAEVAHEAGVPLIVDAAWAAHLGFHPDLPPHALTAGADAMVTSAHKALPAYTQGALVLARTERLDAARLDRAFEATHTTSPTGSIMASIDAARALLERDGKELCARLLSCVAAARQRLREVPGLDVLDGPGVEPTKLVVLLAGTGAHGHAIEADLIAAGMPVEMADRDTMVPTVTVADDAGTVGAFTAKLIEAIERHRGRPRVPVAGAAWTVVPETVMAPRDAFFAPNETVSADQRRRPGQRGADRALPARHPGARARRADHRRRAERAARGTRRRRPHRLRRGPDPRHPAGHQHLARGDGLSRRVPPGRAGGRGLVKNPRAAGGSSPSSVCGQAGLAEFLHERGQVQEAHIALAPGPGWACRRACSRGARRQLAVSCR